MRQTGLIICKAHEPPETAPEAQADVIAPTEPVSEQRSLGVLAHAPES